MHRSPKIGAEPGDRLHIKVPARPRSAGVSPLDGTHRRADTDVMFAEVFHRHGWSFFPSVRQLGGMWQGVVAVRQPCGTRTERLCRMERETQLEAFEDAITAALRLTETV